MLCVHYTVDAADYYITTDSQWLHCCKVFVTHSEGDNICHNTTVGDQVAWLIELKFYVLLNTKWVISETLPKPISWLAMEKIKPNTTKAHIHKSKETYYNTKYTQKKLECGPMPNVTAALTNIHPLFNAAKFG